jgi:2,3-bisphosphoglycerate-independent phosphoglycerate mutase
MKYLIILADGAADEPIEALGGKTPLQAAHTPNIDRLAREGALGRLVTVPEGYHPGSEIANLGVLGYDVHKVFEGRGSLEAASMGVDIEDGEAAMRCNIITIADGKIKNHSGGHISTEEATELIHYLQQELGNDDIRFYPGISYRHLLKLRGADKRVHCTPPHDEVGQPFAQFLPKAECPEAEATARLLTELILKSQEILPNHPINKKRVAEGKDPANSIWPWSLGYRPHMQPMSDIYPIRTGACISAVDLIHGIGVYAGLKKVEVEGATGLYTTNYEGKAAAAIRELRERDFVFLHIEASDEAGHDGNTDIKVKTIEYLDQRCLKPILEEISRWDEPVRIAILPDHPTPIRIRTHTMDPVPFLIWEPGTIPADAPQTFDEASARDGRYGLLKGDEFIRAFFGME